MSPWVREYFQAFMLLKDSRPPVMGGIAPIPLSEIIQCLLHRGVDTIEERERWIRMIRALDAVYVEHGHRRIEQERKRNEAKRRSR